MFVWPNIGGGGRLISLFTSDWRPHALYPDRHADCRWTYEVCREDGDLFWMQNTPEANQ